MSLGAAVRPSLSQINEGHDATVQTTSTAPSLDARKRRKDPDFTHLLPESLDPDFVSTLY